MTELTPVPGHIRTVPPGIGSFCSREGVPQPSGRCPDGCDHADHYSNDGHPECEDIPDLPALPPRVDVDCDICVPGAHPAAVSALCSPVRRSRGASSDG